MTQTVTHTGVWSVQGKPHDLFHPVMKILRSERICCCVWKIFRSLPELRLQRRMGNGLLGMIFQKKIKKNCVIWTRGNIGHPGPISSPTTKICKNARTAGCVVFSPAFLSSAARYPENRPISPREALLGQLPSPFAKRPHIGSQGAKVGKVSLPPEL